VVVYSPPNSPNADVRFHVSSSVQSPWDPSRLVISRFPHTPFTLAIAEVPSPESSGSRDTCPSNDKRLRLDRGITPHDFDVHVFLALANPDMPIPDVNWIPSRTCELTSSQLLRDLTICGTSKTFSMASSHRFSSP
jgi:hypothetical protein